MEIKDLLAALQPIHNGAFFNAEIKGAVNLSADAKKAGHTAYKVSHVTVRKGIDYDAQKSVQDKVLNEGKVLTHELPWGEWSTEPGEENLIINHKGNKYIRLYSSPNESIVKYFLDDVEVSLDELKDSGLVLASFFKPSTEKPDAMTVKIENILAL